MKDRQIGCVSDYLGDGLYVYFDGVDFEVYSSDGIRKLQRIFMSDGEIAAFIRFINRVYKEHAEYRRQLGLAVIESEMKPSHDAS